MLANFISSSVPLTFFWLPFCRMGQKFPRYTQAHKHVNLGWDLPPWQLPRALYELLLVGSWACQLFTLSGGREPISQAAASICCLGFFLPFWWEVLALVPNEARSYVPQWPDLTQPFTNSFLVKKQREISIKMILFSTNGATQFNIHMWKLTKKRS